MLLDRDVWVELIRVVERGRVHCWVGMRVVNLVAVAAVATHQHLELARLLYMFWTCRPQPTTSMSCCLCVPKFNLSLAFLSASSRRQSRVGWCASPRCQHDLRMAVYEHEELAVESHDRKQLRQRLQTHEVDASSITWS